MAGSVKVFNVRGPVRIPRYKAKGPAIVSPEARSLFLQEHPALAEERGCYVMAIQTGGGTLPWYVGKAKGARGFGQECYAADKINKYNRALAEAGKGTPVLYFVSHPKGKTNGRAIEEMERDLIRVAAIRNPKLLNKHGNRNPRWGIKGVVRGGKGKRPQASKSFADAVGFS